MEDESRPERPQERPPLDTDSYKPHTYTTNPTRPFEFFMDSHYDIQSSFQLAESAGLHPQYVNDPNTSNPIKDDMVRRLLQPNRETNLSSIFDLTKLVQFSDQSLELIYRDKGLVGYDNRTGQIYFTEDESVVEAFKKAIYERGIRDSSIFPFQEPMGDDEFDALLAEINDPQVEETVKTHVRETARSNLEAKTSLETTQFTIDEEMARQYHEKINFLESQVEYLKTHQDEDSQKKIKSLERQLEILSEDAKDEITKLQESLQLRETQFLETQREMELKMNQLKQEKENIIQSSEKENQKVVKRENELKAIANQLLQERDSYKAERDNLEKALESNMDAKVQEISNLVDENEKLKKQGKKDSSFQESLQKKNLELIKAVDHLETKYKAQFAITADREQTIKQDKKEIQSKVQKILSYEKELKRLSFFEKRAADLESDYNEQKKIIRAKQEELDTQKEQYEEQLSLLSQEKSKLSKQRDETKTQLNSLASEIETAKKKNRAQLEKEQKSKLSEFQQYDLQIKKLNVDINVYRNKIQSLEQENKVLKDASLSSSQDYSKQLKDIKSKIHQTEIKPLQDEVKELENKILKYKGDLAKANKSHKAAIQKYKEDALKLNDENRKLVEKLKNSKGSSDTTSYETLQRALMENINKFTKLQADYDKLYNESGDKIDALEAEKKVLQDREKDTLEALEYGEKRVEAMTKNAEEYKKQVKDVESQIFDANNKIELNKVKQTQFDKLTSDYNNLSITASKSETEKARLQNKLQKIAKELEELKKTIVPDDVIKQLKHDVKTLNQSLNEREEYLRKNNKHLQDAIQSERQARKAHDDLKANFDSKLKKLTDQSERKLRALREKLKQTLRPAEIKAIAVILSKVGDLNFENVDYDQTRKEILSAIKRYDEKSKDPKTPHANKFLFDEVKKHFEKRLDLLNLAHGRDVETIYGNDQVLNSSEGIKGLLLKLLRLVKRNKFTIAFSVLWSVASWILTNVLVLARGVQSGTAKVAGYLVEKAVQLSPAIASLVLGTAYFTIASLQWFSNHVFEIIVGGIAASATLIKLYGEEFSFPIFAFWSLVGAYCMVLFSRIWSYVPDFIKNRL